MNRRRFLKNSAAGFTGIGIGSRAAGQSQGNRPRRPNILHIMSDMRRWETMGDRSVCNTPNLDRLAREGVNFNRCYTATGPCCPARAMLATGSYHWHNGIYNNVHAPPAIRRDLFPDAVTYYQRLRDVGYKLAYFGKWHASFERTPLNFGFHEIGAPIAYNPSVLNALDLPPEEKRPISREGKRVALGRAKFPGSDDFGYYGYDESEEEETADFAVAEEALQAIRRLSNGDNPWLIEVHFPESSRHYPLKKYLDRYDPAEIPIPPSFYETFESKPGLHRMEAEIWAQNDESDVQKSRASYYGAFEQQDIQIGRVLAALEETGQRDNTLVTFSVDHGEMGGAHHMWGTGWMQYEENYRMPMCVRWPERILPGGTCDALVQVHDLAHTYVDIAGAEQLPYRDGSSLLPLFDDPNRALWNEHIYNAFYGQEFLYVIRTLITPRYKYVFNSFDIDECYDLVEDPDEMHNRMKDPAFKAIVDDLRARIYEMMVQTEDPFGDNPPAKSGRRQVSRALAPRYLPRGRRIGG